MVPLVQQQKFTNRRYYPTKPTNWRTAFTLLGSCQFRTADSFSGSHAKPVRPTMCPRKPTSVCINVHFLALSCRPKSLRRASTSYRCASASGIDFPKEMTSSKHTRQRDHRIPHSTRSMSRSNVAGALHNPNGITRN